MKAPTLISQVGEQPGAIATIAKTLRKANPSLASVVLFPSAKTHDLAGRLKGNLEALDLEVEIRPPGDHDAQRVVEWARGASRSGPVWFNCSAGPSYFVGKVSRALRDCPWVEAVYGSFDSLHAVGSRWRMPLHDVGLKELLDLHGLAWSAGSTDGRIQRSFSLLDEGSASLLDASAAYERRGRLFCLFERVQSLDDARHLLDLRKRRSSLHELQPHLTVQTDKSAVADRLRLAGIDVILGRLESQAVARRVERWWKRNPMQPGRTPRDRTPGPDVAEPASVSGEGGDGRPLVVCLGAEPDATLQALWAHKPQVAWVLYDESTPYVRAVADRLAAEAGSMPVGELHFLPVNHTGAGIGERKLVHHLRAHAPVLANVTPGTKAQAWALAHLTDRLAIGCSLDTRGAPKVAWLSDDAKVSGTRWDVPSLLSQVAVRGGPLADRGKDEGFLSERGTFLSEVSGLVAMLARSERRGLFVLWPHWRKSKASCDAGSLEWWRKDVPEQTEWTRLVVQVDRPSASRLCGEFKLPMQPGREGRRQEPKAGAWLEELVGHVFLVAGAKELHVGMIWGWPERPEMQRTEMDVVCRWGSRGLVGVSVKASALRDKERARCHREISAMVYECLGRFGLPVLLTGIPTSALQPEAVLAEFDNTGVLELGIGHLDRPQEIKQLLDQAFERLQRFAKSTSAPTDAR